MFLKFVQNTFGLDISEKVWRMVQLKKTGSKIKLTSYSEIKVPSDFFEESQIVKKDKAAALLKRLIQETKGAKIFTKYTYVCLPEPKTFIKVIDITYPKSKDIVHEIIEETKKHIPYPLEKIYLDWQYIDERKKGKVVVGVCPKNIVNNYQEILVKAGLMPIALEIEAIAIARSLFPLDKKVEEPVMVIDLGASRTGLFIYKENYALFTISLNISSDDLTVFIKNKLKLTMEQAEKAKRKIGLNPNKAKGGLIQVLKEPLEGLAQQIREAKYFYYEHFTSSEEIKKVYLTGGGANLNNITKFLSDQVKLEVVLGNPLINISPGKISLEEDKIQTYATVIGLALRQYQ